MVSGCTSGRDTLEVSLSNCGAIPPSASKEVAPEPVEGRYGHLLQNLNIMDYDNQSKLLLHSNYRSMSNKIGYNLQLMPINN